MDLQSWIKLLSLLATLFTSLYCTTFATISFNNKCVFSEKGTNDMFWVSPLCGLFVWGPLELQLFVVSLWPPLHAWEKKFYSTQKLWNIKWIFWQTQKVKVNLNQFSLKWKHRMNCELLPSVALNCQVTQIASRFSTYILKVKKFDAGAEDDPQNVDRKVPSIASNNRNCPTIVLVGGWKLATIPPSSLGTVRK